MGTPLPGSISVSCWAVVRVLHVLRVTKKSTRSGTCCIPWMSLSDSSSACNTRVKTLVHFLLVGDETKHLKQNTTHLHLSRALRASRPVVHVGAPGRVVPTLRRPRVLAARATPRHWPVTIQHRIAGQPEGWTVALRCWMVVGWHWPRVPRLASPGCSVSWPQGWSDPVPCQIPPLPLGTNRSFLLFPLLFLFLDLL